MPQALDGRRGFAGVSPTEEAQTPNLGIWDFAWKMGTLSTKMPEFPARRYTRCSSLKPLGESGPQGVRLGPRVITDPEVADRDHKWNKTKATYERENDESPNGK